MRTLQITENTIQSILTDLLKRSPNQYTEFESSVNEIIETVRRDKDAAVFTYTKQFDHVQLTAENVEVSAQEIEAAYRQVAPKLLNVIKKHWSIFGRIMKSRSSTAGSTVPQTV